jgi:hypothetical protein
MRRYAGKESRIVPMTPELHDALLVLFELA